VSDSCKDALPPANDDDRYTTTTAEVAFIGAGFCAGQSTTGVAHGPAALRASGLPEAVSQLGKQWSEVEIEFWTDPNLLEMSPDGGLHKVKEAVEAAATAGAFALTIGGDHSIAAASIAGLATVYPELAIIWVDAHADANTPATSPSGNYHGMPAAHLMGWFNETPLGFEWLPKEGCIPEENLAYIALRDVDPTEAKMLRDSRVALFTMRDVDQLGIAKVVELALAAVDPSGNRALHLSLDIDAVDPLFAPGTGTKASGGLTPREVRYVCTECARSQRLVGMDVVEVNPDLDPPGDDTPLHGDNPALTPGLTPTVKLAAECVLAAFDDGSDLSIR
jgi:arginase